MFRLPPHSLSPSIPAARQTCPGGDKSLGSRRARSAWRYAVTPEHEVMEACLNEIGICFAFAPVYHAATNGLPRRQSGVLDRSICLPADELR